MIKQIDLAAPQKGVEVDKDLAKYIVSKIGKLDRHLKRRDREVVRADVKLKENKSNDNKKCTCEVILHIPGARLTAIESTSNMYAAVDIVEAKLRNQLKRHKEKHSQSKDKHKNHLARRALGKIFSRKSR